MPDWLILFFNLVTNQLSCKLKHVQLTHVCTLFQINLFESLYVRVSKMEDQRLFCGWLQMDVSPFKHTLMNVIKK